MSKQKKSRNFSPEEKQQRAERRQALGQLRNNNGWDDLNQLYEQCVEMLNQPMLVLAILEQDGMMEAILPEDHETLNKSVLLLAQDTVSFTGKLASIHDSHKGKRGNWKINTNSTPMGDEQEHVAGLRLHEQYIQFTEAFRATCVPVMNSILAITARAEVAEKRALERAAGTSTVEVDPASIKEVSTQPETSKEDVNG